MELRFWIDPETGLPHIFNHGVTEQEVRQVLSRTGEEFSGSDRSRIRLGQTEGGRYLQVVYVPDEDVESAFVVTAFDLSPKAKLCASETPTEKKEMTERIAQAYPAGWDEERVRKLAEHYDNQTEAEQVAEHEAAFLDDGQTVMVVPTELVPAIVKLISEKRPA